MSYCLNLLICLLCIILQTAVFPHLLLFDRFYDLLIPFIIYLGIYRPAPESIITLVLAGALMDGLSGGVFGLHLAAYLWIYLASVWLARYLHLVNSILLPFVVAGGVLVQNILCAAVALGKSPTDLNIGVLATVGVQLLLAVLTGPMLLLFYRILHTTCEQWVGRYLTRRNGASG